MTRSLWALLVLSFLAAPGVWAGEGTVGIHGSVKQGGFMLLAQNDTSQENKKSTIEGTTAGGETETTIVDENGNLKSVTITPPANASQKTETTPATTPATTPVTAPATTPATAPATTTPPAGTLAPSSGTPENQGVTGSPSQSASPVMPSSQPGTGNGSPSINQSTHSPSAVTVQ